MQSTFELELFKTDDEGEQTKETVTVRIQQVSPFITADIMALVTIRLDGDVNFKTGTFAKECVKHGLIVSPKNLLERIDDSDNAVMAIATIFREVSNFIHNPRVYRAKELDSKAKSDRQVEDMGDSVQQLD